jgi:signal recognition particle receptor subunit beta
MLINPYAKKIHFKLVYYGAAMGGKTTNVRYLAEHTTGVSKDMLSLATRGERTLYFDMLQLTFGQIGGYKTIFNLYTTPGQTVYVASRKLVLHGADALIFVMDSQQSRLRDNVQAWYTLERQLLELHTNKHRMPILIQLNKRDMPYIATRDHLLTSIRADHFPVMEACADRGIGVFESLRWGIARMVDQALRAFKSEGDALPVSSYSIEREQ